jgi:ABC-type multidrug transport system ATPase subunit
MTVRETLEFAARLKSSDEEKVQNKIRDIVQQLKLEKCLDVVVGGYLLKGISGGEKKRTSIAVELISDPQVFVLDEPTSGMDSLTSFIIVNQLKLLAKEGKTIFLTIHQPNSEIYALFDNLLLMIDGKIIYQGPADQSLHYFYNNFGLQCPEF